MDKFTANRERDSRKADALRGAGWLVATVWECALSKPGGNVEAIADTVRDWVLRGDGRWSCPPIFGLRIDSIIPRSRPPERPETKDGIGPPHHRSLAFTRDRRCQRLRAREPVAVSPSLRPPLEDRLLGGALRSLVSRGTLSRHVSQGKVAFGINHRMRDFQHDREKDLDLVICRRSQPRTQSGLGSFAEMVEAYEIVLGEEEHRMLMDLPEVQLTGVQTALVALEAKAAFTEFGKARPRLYDELNSSHLTIHGDTDQAIAVGLAMIDAAGSFVSPLRNPWSLGTNPTVVNKRRQPQDADSTLAKVRQLPRRPAPGQRGFDAVGVVMLNARTMGHRSR